MDNQAAAVDTTENVSSLTMELTDADKAYLRGDIEVAEALSSPGGGKTTPGQQNGAETQKTNPSGEGNDAPPADPAEKELVDEEFLALDEKSGTVRDTRTNKFVPHQALHRARLKARNALQKLAETNQTLATTRERLDIVNQYIMPPDKKEGAADAPKDPWADDDIDPTTDFVGAQGQLAARQRWDRQQREEQSKRAESETAVRTFRSDVTAFAKETPDFSKAAEHVKAVLMEDAADQGIAEDKREAYAIGVIKQRALAAMRQNKNAGEALYAFAKRAGYTPQPKEEPKADVAAAAKEAADKVDAISKVQDASKTISNAGTAPSSGLTLPEYLAMSTADASAFHAKTGQAGMRKLMREWGVG